MNNRSVITGYNAGFNNTTTTTPNINNYVFKSNDEKCDSACVMQHELDDDDISIPLVTCGGSAAAAAAYYGSTAENELTSTQPWYADAYDELDCRRGSSCSSNTRSRLVSTSSRGRLNNDDSSGVYCEESCCSDTDPVVVITSHRVNVGDSSDMFTYTTYDESSVTDAFNMSPLVSKDQRATKFASTALVGWNILNLLLSTSLLAFPFAISRGGYIVLPFIVVIAAMANYTSRILVEMMYETTSRGRVRVRVDYVDLGQDIFNSFKGAIFVQMLQILEMVAICVLNLCVLGNLGHEIIRSLNIRLTTALAAVLAFPTFFVQKLVIIGWLQTIGVFSLGIGLILIQGFCVVNYVSWSASNVPVYNVRDLPIAIGIVVYAFGVQNILPGLEERMNEPKKYGRVINITFFLALLVQCVFSITNALYYGKNTNQLITIDLADHFELGISTAFFIGVSILSHFSLPSMVVMEKLDDALHKLFPYCGGDYHTIRHKMMTVLIRMFVMGVSLMIAVIVPYFAYLMAFIGSLITVLLALVVPCCFHLKLLSHSISPCEKFIDVVIILFGVVCVGLGGYLSFDAIYSSDAS